MAEKEHKTFKVEMDIPMMQDIISVIDYVSKYPCQKSSLWRFKDELRKIIQVGCFKHNILRDQFKIASDHTMGVCPKCSPKEHAKYKKEAEEFEQTQ